MPRGDKSAYTAKQKRKARHIEESLEKSGVSARTAARLAWATVNKQDGGGLKKRSARGNSARKGSRKGSRKKASSSASRRKSTASRSAGRSASARRKSR
jgi:hypothetical protein